MRALRELELRVPEDVAIIGGSNEPNVAEMPPPSLSSVEINYERIGYGGQGHVVPPIDVLPELRQVEAGKISAAVAGLLEKKGAQIEELNTRLSRMSEVLERVALEIEALQ